MRHLCINIVLTTFNEVYNSDSGWFVSRFKYLYLDLRELSTQFHILKFATAFKIFDLKSEEICIQSQCRACIKV